MHPACLSDVRHLLLDQRLAPACHPGGPFHVGGRNRRRPCCSSGGAGPIAKMAEGAADHDGGSHLACRDVADH